MKPGRKLIKLWLRGIVKMDKYSQLVQDLNEGSLNLTLVRNAVREHLKNYLPTVGLSDIEDLLVGKNEASAGIVFHVFELITEVKGLLELAYLRGKQAGKEIIKMDPATLALAATIARIVLINIKNLVLATQKAKYGDGKITLDELPTIVFDAAIRSCEDLGAGDFAALVKGK